jgi:hypothetical protein
VPDDDGLGEAELAAQKGEVVGEELHGVSVMRLVALPMSAQIRRHDSVAMPREMLEFRGEEAVIAAPAVNEQDRRLLAFRFLVEQ